MYSHDDYLTYPLHCAEFLGRDYLAEGDVIWVRHPDGFNPWGEMVRIHTVRQNGWFSVQEVGGNDHLGTPQLRWWGESERFFAARIVAEAQLAERS